jgi:hypothetical protein
LSILVFGSLGRGNWDAYSDLDLDVILADGVEIIIAQELARLCAALAAIGERAALAIPDGDEEGDVVFESLMQLSIRYHPLSATSPNIVDSMQILAGQLDRAVIEAAGWANRSARVPPLPRLLDQCVRYAVGAQVVLQRRRIWDAVETLHRMRGILMELFARTHGGQRAYQFFDANADARLQARLGVALPGYDLHSARKALMQLLDILENDLPDLTGGQIALTDAQHLVLRRIRSEFANS